jgi:L-threonylcarbamoyladenylate synthase
MAHVEAGLGKSIPVLDGGACSVGIESTIVSVAADGQWQLLRPGMISEEAIARVTGMPQQVYQVQSAAKAIPKAPGQHALHYSPRTPMLLFSNKVTLMHEFAALTQAQKQCAALLIGPGDAPNCNVIQLPSQPEDVAERLYSALHALDDLKVDCLLVELPPNTPEWAAVLDRLNRAGYQ